MSAIEIDITFFRSETFLVGNIVQNLNLEHDPRTIAAAANCELDRRERTKRTAGC